MGSPATAVAESPVKLFWQDRPTKYVLESGNFQVDELTTPWDLYAEGAFFGNAVGITLHQLLVKHGLERIFSLRTIGAGIPCCDIITIPEKAPGISFSYSSRRILNTSKPMLVDGQKLILLDAVGYKGKRVEAPLLNLVREFYLSMGGQLSGEHPNGFVFNGKKDMKRWLKIAAADLLLDMVVAEKPTAEILKAAPHGFIHAPNIEIAIELTCMRFWHEGHVDGDSEFGKEFIKYLLTRPDDAPYNLTVYGHTEQAYQLWDEVKKLYAKKVKK